ncbi:MAG: aminopeptidase P family protein [Syntrophaceae bacterium]|nr:aminopeptidase P family protein [Syntrophaceae bacterium]
MTKQPLSDRIRRLQLQLDAWGIDALLFFDMNNIRYFTGFSGSEGVLLVGPGCTAHLLVDGRYTTQAKAETETEGIDLVHMTDKIKNIASLLTAQSIGIVGFEDAVTSVQLLHLLKKKNRRVRFKPVSGETEFLRSCKDDQEIILMRGAARIAADSLNAVLPFIKSGACERDIALELEYRMRKNGADKVAFDTIIASGPNGALPHSRAGNRKFKPGDAVVVDYGAVYKGYHSDETCTFFIERVETDLKAVYGLVKEAHDRAMDAAIAGRLCREVDRVARDIISREGWGGHFTHGTGHGVGLDVHEPPRVSPQSECLLAEGMVVTIEPGIYLPGKWGVRIEDTILVTSGKAEVLTKMSKEITILG